MEYLNYSIILSEAFPEDILSSTLKNKNELYIDVNGNNIEEIAAYMSGKLSCPLVSMFATDERSQEQESVHQEQECGHKATKGGHKRCGFAVYYAFLDRENSLLIVLKTALAEGRTHFNSICRRVPAASGYEREIHDLFGLVPDGHPEPKRMVLHGNWPEGNYPLRKDFKQGTKPKFVSAEQEFRQIEGTGVYEIPVGPVHAGIIEPGHFRFSVAGEPIINLEAQLHFVHKGIEKLCEGKDFEKVFYISERISGDETFSNSLAYCQAVEKIAGVKVLKRASYTRMIFAELERLICHFGDLSGICTDVAYGFAAAHFNLLRIWSYALADELCNVRFLRSVNVPGGVRRDFLKDKKEALLEALDKIEKELDDIVGIINRNNMFLDRVEHTGLLDRKIAEDLNAVGPGGRAVGVVCDVRKSFPYEKYAQMKFEEAICEDGDVAARMQVKIKECYTSISIMRQAAEAMREGDVRVEITSLPPEKSAFGLTESSRGENVHFVMTDKDGNIERYKVRTPSFCNWPALCHAVNGNIVPDFPLVNKSFNLSYAGNDL